MDAIDTAILNIIQEKFPLVQRPFAEIGERVGISESECLERVKRLKEEGIIRRLGGVFDSPAMGMVSTLCAMTVPEEDVDMVAAIVNAYPEVTHNYLRSHSLNMWFTVTASDEERKQQIINEIENKSGCRVYSMPVRRTFKIKAVFPVGQG